jgi:hypothetical protein
MPTDFRDGKTYPRRGRDEVDGFLWLWRVADKGRAHLAGTIYDYIYPCPMDKGVFERWGITAAEFEAALAANPDDASLLAWAKATIPEEKRRAANAWLLNDKRANMDRQDSEEGVVAA